jgi:hypothetical protein
MECAINDSLISNSINIAQSGEAYLYTYVKIKSLLEYNKQSVNLLKSLPSHIFESEQLNTKESEPIIENTNIVDTINDFEQFLGDDMKNISVPELNSKVVVEEKKKNTNSGNSLLISKTLTNDLSVLESMLNASIRFNNFESGSGLMNPFETMTFFIPYLCTSRARSVMYS